ncbi:MAG: hypothetical protein AMXMBFR84_15270 [Candidatus Hydrogenedentota bacterium]
MERWSREPRDEGTKGKYLWFGLHVPLVLTSCSAISAAGA